MYPDYWDEYMERMSDDTDTKPIKQKPAEIPTHCFLCKESLDGQTKSFRACDYCYDEHVKGNSMLLTRAYGNVTLGP